MQQIVHMHLDINVHSVSLLIEECKSNCFHDVILLLLVVSCSTTDEDVTCLYRNTSMVLAPKWHLVDHL